MRFATDPPQTPPEVDRIDFGSEALAALVASGPVAELVREFNRSLVGFNTKQRTYDDARVAAQSQKPPDRGLMAAFTAADERLTAAGQEVLRIGLELAQRMRQEMGTEGTLPPNTSGLPEIRPTPARQTPEGGAPPPA
jgi:hypothetical protein